MKIVITLAALLFSYQLSWAGCGDTEFFKTAGY
jgi:hypothetical protein